MRRAPSLYEETRQLFLKRLRGYARLCGVHLADIQMVARISARPGQNDRER